MFGYLYQLYPSTNKYTINKMEFSVGRKNDCDVFLRKDFYPENYNAISKVHFVINVEAGKVTVRDQSSNGTFINGVRLGKGKSKDLTHLSHISLTTNKVQHFLFVSSSKEHFRAYPKRLNEKYLVCDQLGKGACGTVYLGLKKATLEKVAVKTIPRSQGSTLNINAHNVMNEIELLRAVDHPCIIRLEEVIDSPENVFIVLELAQGGELFDKIVNKMNGKFDEREAKLHFYQILSAVKYMHDKNIAHRDLKPENILLCSRDDENPIIKVTDLGLSKFVDMHTHLKTFCGTPQYLAPEILTTKSSNSPTACYDLKVDMWSVGVILYILLSGHPPFSNDKTELVAQIVNGEYDFESRPWKSISKEAIDLVSGLMCIDPKRRLSAGQALEHAWMKDADVVDKAEKLMNTQRREPLPMEVSVLNGILTPEFSKDSALGESIQSNEGCGQKRANDAADDAANSACKRAKIN